jgi:hypothetical protein
MGTPEKVEERATFQWRVERTYAEGDSAGDPYDWTSTPTEVVARDEVQIDVAVEMVGTNAWAAETPVGQFNPTRVMLTIMDDDYVKVEGADTVLLGGATYNIDYVAPPQGLFDVTVYQMYCRALDES